MHKRPLLAMLLMPCAALAQQDPQPQVARTFADFAQPSEGRRWRTVLDGVMGGRSTGRFVVEEQRMLFSGVLNTNGGGFSSVRRRGGDLRLGVPGELGIRLRVRGDGRTYTLRLRQPVRGLRYTPSYRAGFTTSRDRAWQEVFIPYADLRPTWRGRKLDLPPVDPARVDEVGISIDDKIDGPFRLEVRDVSTYGAFSFDDYRGGRRPLVVFAANADCPDLQRQLATADDEAGGFAERDLTVVVVLDDGASTAGARELSPTEAATLRKRFASHRRRGFAALLVGKDGAVKRSSAEPVDATTLFEQVDSMPMRIQELRRRVQ